MISDIVMQHQSHARLRMEAKADMSQRYYQRLVGHLSGRLGGRDKRLIWTGDRYRHLAQINLLIVEVRKRIERQKAHLVALEDERRSTTGASARLRQFEMTLHLMNYHRANILEKMRAFR